MLHRDGPMADRPALDGFWLPARAAEELETEVRSFGPGRVPVRVPRLTPRTLREAMAALRRRRAEVLAGRPVADILAAIEAAARRLTDPGEPYHAELLELLPGLTGYSERMIEIGLERVGAGWAAEPLRVALQEEFGSLGILDDFQPREPGGWCRAFGPAVTVHVFSGNIPGVAVTSLIRALCVKSASFGKTAEGEPYLAVCFARALADRDPELASCLAVCYWPGGAEEYEAAVFAEADAVIAYGSDRTIADIRRRVPERVNLLEYPNRVGAALVARERLTDDGVRELARLAARDVAAFDQQGCVSPHVIYVERGGAVTPLGFARALAGSLELLSVEIPRGAISTGDSILIHQLRAQAELRGATVLASERGTEWTVIVEDRSEFEPSPLHRVIHLRPVDDLSRAAQALARVGRHLQTVAIAAAPDEVRSLAERLGEIGASRVVPLGRAAWPSAHWHHDGRFQFADLVRFVDLETE